MFRKFLAFASVIVIILLGFIFYHNNKEMKPISNKDITVQNNKKAEELKIAYPEEYGGIFIDEEGILNIDVVGEGKNIKRIMKDTNVKFHNVKYSWKYLKYINDSLCNRLVELDIKAMELDEKNNKVVIYLDDPEDSEKINSIRKIIDSPAIEYKKFDGEIITTN